MTPEDKARVVALIKRGLKEWRLVASTACSPRPEARALVRRAYQPEGVQFVSEDVAALEAVGREIDRLERERQGAEALLAAVAVRALPELVKRLAETAPSPLWTDTPDDVTAALAGLARGTEALRWWRRALVSTVGGPVLPGEDA